MAGGEWVAGAARRESLLLWVQAQTFLLGDGNLYL